MAHNRTTTSKGKGLLTPWMLNVTVPAFIVAIALSFVVYLTWQSNNSLVITRRDEVIDRKASESMSRIKSELNALEDMLRASKGLLDSENSITVTRDSWQRFVDALDIETRHPGVKHLVYAEVFNEQERAEHENTGAQQHGDLLNDAYRVFPETGQDLEYASVLYVAPYEEANSKLLGYNLYSDELTERTLKLARDNDSTTIVSTYALAEEDLAVDTNNFLQVTPVFSSSDESVNESQAPPELSAYVYASYVSSIFFSSALSDEENYSYLIELKDGGDVKQLYRTDSTKSAAYTGTRQTATDHIEVDGKTLSLYVTNTSSILPDSESNRPRGFLIYGGVFVLLVAGFIYLLTLARVRDLREQEQEGLREAKDDLLALASHQLRTPATGVKQYLGMVREGYVGKLSKQQMRLIDSAYDSNERQLHIVNELLFVARMDSGKVTLMLEKINIQRLIKKIINEQHSSISEKNLTVETRLLQDPLTVSADAGYLRMALENIINNAIKYTPENGRVRVSLSTDEHNACVSVQDSGVGVAEKDIPKLFQKFSRISNDLTSQLNGTGIGLYLSAKIIEAHDGTITFKSKPKKGSTVIIKLPRVINNNSNRKLDISQ